MAQIKPSDTKSAIEERILWEAATIPSRPRCAGLSVFFETVLNLNLALLKINTSTNGRWLNEIQTETVSADRSGYIPQLLSFTKDLSHDNLDTANYILSFPSRFSLRHQFAV